MNVDGPDVQIARLEGKLDRAADKIDSAMKAFERHIELCDGDKNKTQDWRKEVDLDRARAKASIRVMYLIGGFAVGGWGILKGVGQYLLSGGSH